ncbi:hypothetical protein [Glycomyces algeriensis]|uniref:DUF2567 domain-containing protein n=1 Tax=Glycomyces algeriensis TaxID=256037 RepID=A0A9W6G8T9_9ACTN|nr:hypothetical protein [Glycomyces algeriensis]MDA1365154.1 hypothetical protein [Glycomyces algeriensis]MDR7349782.1 hypothetical protein [Glycomyces algeriensis]GLI42491.1 hypothetical protein GALLR39Z86_23410 [Glycomyces algeriensis]
MTDDAERTVNLRPDDSAGREGAAVAPAEPADSQGSASRDGSAARDGSASRDDGGHVYGRSPRSERTIGRDLLAAGFLAVVLTALGVPAAMLWQVATPRVEFEVLEGGWASIETYPSGYVEGDLAFAGIGLVLGILAAAFAWAAMRERRGPLLLLGLVIGSIGCQVVAWKIGAKEWQQFWDSVERAPVGAHVWRPPSVLFVELDPAAAWAALKVGNLTTALDSLQLGALAVMALAATFTYTVCAGWSRRPSLRTDAPE